MGQENQSNYRLFSKKFPPAFDRHTCFSVYKQNVATKKGPALIGRLSGEAKSADKMLGVSAIGSEESATKILDHLNKSYGVDDIDLLDIDFAFFLDFIWSGIISVEEYIAGFHSRLDKISELAINDKLKVHLLIRQAGLDDQTRNVLVSTASGNYAVDKISAAMRQAFRNLKNAYHGNMSTTSGRRGRKNRGANLEEIVLGIKILFVGFRRI